MGQSNTKIPDEKLKELQGRTRYSPQELQQWYNVFSKGRNSGNISKEDFIFQNLGYTRFGDEAFWGGVFDILDSDRSGFITFNEWVIALSLLSTQALDTKAEWIFNTIDRDGNGTISKGELEQMLKFVSKLSNDPSFTVESIFTALDKDKSGMISLKEFQEGVISNTSIIKYLDLSNLLQHGLTHVGSVSSPALRL